MKRLLSLLLTLALALGLSAPALAATPAEAQAAAQLLYDLNLFRGVGEAPDGSVNFALDRAPTRAETVTMLVRLLGAEEAATAQPWRTPFLDLPDWAAPYIGYAYQHGLTNGIAEGYFGAESTVTAAQALTLLLRALGYQDGTDFSWEEPWQLTDQLGITDGEYSSATPFLRGDVALVSDRALYAPCKQGETLLEVLLNAGVFDGSQAVIWDFSSLAFEKDFASFLFYPVAGSPATFSQFKVNQVTVNGLPCQTLQVTTPEAVAAYLASLGEESGGFGYVEVSYNQAAALRASDRTYTDENGVRHPLLCFTFSYTATQRDGATLSGSFTADYYLAS